MTAEEQEKSLMSSFKKGSQVNMKRTAEGQKMEQQIGDALADKVRRAQVAGTTNH
jgi:hypothetical protein